MFGFILTLSLVAFTTATNYCQQGLCSPGQRHIGCQNSGALSSSCPAGSIFLDLKSLRKQIVHDHNKLRNMVAGGKIRKLKSAVRMATIKWDNELAYLAGLNVKTCKFDHDECRNTPRFRFSGQNLAKKWWYGSNPNISTLIGEQIQSWFDEKEFCDMGKINKVPRTSNGPVIGHFTAMIHEKTTRVGCAAMKSWEWKRGIKMDSLLLCCNYDHTNVVGYKIYRSGRAASKCTTGRNKKYKNLCSEREVYNVNIPLR